MALRSCLESLEPRRLLAWGAYAHQIGQDLAVGAYSKVDGRGKVIVVIDTGVNAIHQSLASHLWKNPGEIPGDGKDNDRNGYNDDVTGYDFVRDDPVPNDESGHGTGVVGIIAASPFRFNGATYAGLAPRAKVICLKVLDGSGAYTRGAERRIERALRWVEAMNRRVPITAVNLSLYTPTKRYRVYTDELQRLTAAGVIVSASGGQDNPNRDVHYPALDPVVWATSVVDESDRVSTDVNRGPNLDLLAPGVRVPVPTRTVSGFAASEEGSSYAAAHVTAAAALVRQVWPTATPAQVLKVLKDGGTPVRDASIQYKHSGRTYARLSIDAALRLAFRRRPLTPGVQVPYAGTPFATGARIEAEDFDQGGEGISFYDTTAAKAAGVVYRRTPVDVAPSRDADGGFVVGYTAAGEWLEYTVRVSTAGTYAFAARVASPAEGARFHVEADGANATGPVAIPRTGSWAAYTTVTASGVNLPTGTHVLRVRMDANNARGYAGNFDWFSLTAVATPSSPATQRIHSPSRQRLRDVHALLRDDANPAVGARSSS